MAITVPGELDFALDMLGFEWPNIDEDAVRDAATLLRTLREDLQTTLDTLDDRIDGDLSEAFTSKTASAYIEAWTENRTQNMDQMLDLLPGVADGLDLFADAVVALKTKVIAELVITAAQLAATAASAVLTLGASAAASAAILVARKKALDILTQIAVEELIGQIAVMVIEPLTSSLDGLVAAVLDHPITSSGSQPQTYDADYDLMEQIADAIDDCGTDQEELLSTFASQVAGLPIFAA